MVPGDVTFWLGFLVVAVLYAIVHEMMGGDQ